MPHAYLKGNIIECMANSDNVVRVGLTPKFRDAETLLRIVDATPRTPEVLTGDRVDDACTVYETPAAEFEMRRWSLPADTERVMEDAGGPAILLVVKGLGRPGVARWSGRAPNRRFGLHPRLSRPLRSAHG